MLTWLLLAVDADVSLSTDILAFLLLVVAVALVGGLLPAVLAAVGGFLLLNYFFTPPVRMFTVAERENLLALFAFLVVAVSSVPSSTLPPVVPARRRRPRAEAATLFTLAGSVLRGSRPLPALLEQIRETFAFDASLSSSGDRRPSADLIWNMQRGVDCGRVRRQPNLSGTQAMVMPKCTSTTPTPWSCPGMRSQPRIGGSWRPSPPRRPSPCGKSVSRRRPPRPARWPRSTD